MNIVPQGCRVIVELMAEDNSPIIVPDIPKEDEIPQNGSWRVVAIGDPRILDNGERLPIPLSIGDEVAIHPRLATRMLPSWKYDGRTLLVVEMAGILAKVERPGGPPKDQPKKNAILTQSKSILVPR